MSVKTILQKGDPVLGKKCHEVTVFDKKLHALLRDMKETLDESGGVGLAAPQIGILRRVVLVIDDNDNLIELINPEIVETSGEQDGLEGCLSLAGYYGYVTRPMCATVKAKNRFGEEFTVSGEGLTARCFCHELEHLEGHLFDEHTEELFTTEEIDEMTAKEKKRGRRKK